MLKNSPHEGFEEVLEVQQSTDNETPWRIWYISEQEVDNPIIESCLCAGSIKYIHFKCLKEWMKSKVNIKNETSCHYTLNWKNFECELWKQAYPYIFMLNGQRWNLVDLKRPEDKDTPYIILESLNNEKNSSRTIHTVVINTDKTCFSLGRGHDSDLRINDISVSRKHANLTYRQSKFYFEDLKSKFGTLVLHSNDIELSDNASKTFQIGRTVVTLKAKLTQPWKNKGRYQKNHNLSYLKVFKLLFFSDCAYEYRPRNTSLSYLLRLITNIPIVTEVMFKDPTVKEQFMKTKNQLGKHNQTMSPSAFQDELSDKIQGPVPAFETNQSKRVIESVENREGDQQILLIDGKRYVVVQELTPNDEDEKQE